MRSEMRDQGARPWSVFRLFTWTLAPLVTTPSPPTPWVTQGMPEAYHIPLSYRFIPEPQMPHFRIGMDHHHGFLLCCYCVCVGIRAACGF